MAARTLNALVPHLRRVAGRPGDGTLTDAELLERWAVRRDEAAFELLLWRYGPMVLAACRRILCDAHASEDAFQATWLVLVRRFGSLRDGRALPAWLHRVACRVALRARAAAARRASREQPVGDMPAPAGADEASLHEVRAVVDEEIDRLPEPFRRAFVLCVLEERTQAEAARLLGRPEGTVSAWLARARQRLRGRLERRGVTLGAAAAGVGLAEGLAPARLTAAQVLSTARAAAQIAAGKAAASAGISGEVAALMKGTLESMSMVKIKLSALVFLVLAGAAAVALARQSPREGPSPARAEEPARGAADPGTPVNWGKPADGLQAGIGFRPGDRRTCSAGDSVTLVFYLRNVGPRAIRLSHIETLFAEWMPSVEDADGKRVGVAPGPANLGIVPVVRRSLDPGEQITLGHPWFRVRPPSWRGPVECPTLRAAPGKYRISYAGLPLRLDGAGQDCSAPPTGWLELEVEAAGAWPVEPLPETGAARQEGSTNPADRWLLRWEQELKRRETFSVHCKRIERDKPSGESQRWSGTALFLLPDLARLEVRREGDLPIYQKFLLTGRALYEYIPERKEIRRRAVPAAGEWLQGGDYLPLFVSSGRPGDVRRHFDVRLAKEDQYYVYLELTPRRAGEVRRARVVMYKEGGLPRQIWVEYPVREVTWDFPGWDGGVPLDRKEFADPVAPPRWKITPEP
jgi:RNA polymerase sigma factor (sigma-70 family)